MTSFARIAILDLVLGIILPKNGILITFPTAVIMHHMRNCVIITGFFFIGISTKRIKWCEKDGLSSSHAFLSTWNDSVLQDGLDADRTAPVKNFFLPTVRNQNVPHQLRVNCYSTRVSLNCSEVSQGIFGILAELETRLAASLMHKSKPTFL